MASPSSSRATKRRRSSTTEHSFQGIATSPAVSGGKCYPCVRYDLSPMSRVAHITIISTSGELLSQPPKHFGKPPVSKATKADAPHLYPPLNETERVRPRVG